jgi:diguanylate cyclase (GGDEF)-like protein/PAS domain S-box-containing protein
MRFLLQRRVFVVAAAAALYFLVARLGLTLAFTAEQVTLVWPATGLALAAVLLVGRDVWPGIWLGALSANLLAHESLLVSAGVATGNTLEALTAAWLLRRFAGLEGSMEGFKPALGLVLFGALLSTAVSATIGVTSLCAGGVQPWGDYRSLWYTWWLGDAMGDLLVAPVLLTWTTWPRLESRRRSVEGAALLGGLTAVGLLVFTVRVPSLSTQQHPLEYLVFPFVIWGALRFGHRGSAFASLVASAIAIAGTVHGRGPFVGNSVTENLILLQVFMAVMAATGLLLGAVVSENDAATRRREAQHATTRVLADASSVDEAIQRILQLLCIHLRWDVGLFWRLDRERQQLECTHVWSRPSAVPADFECRMRQRTLAIGHGLSGRIWADASPRWVQDATADPDGVHPAVEVGLQTAFGFPILLDGGVVGVLEFCRRDRRAIDSVKLQMCAALGSQIGQFIARTRAEQHVAESEARKAGVLDGSLDCIVTMDHDGRIIEFNGAAERTFGHTRRDVLGHDLASLILPPAMSDYFRQAMAHTASPGESVHLDRRLEITAFRADGAAIPVELSVTRVVSEGPPLFTAYLRDISEHKRLIDELAFRASHDLLTQLLNRAAFMERLEARARPTTQSDELFGVLLLDIDRFKAFNDEHGHLFGDQLLLAVARRLHAAVRPNDVVARLGGDEFAVLLHGLDGERRATAMAERIMQTFSQPFTLNRHYAHASVSVGVAVSGAINRRPEDLLRAADTALYDAKALGRGRYQVFEPSMHARARARLKLEDDLRRALRQKEFKLHYQPIVSLRTGKTTSLEALLRWAHPQRGLIGPAEFVSVAEDTGLIVPVGTWVLHTACAEATVWRRMADPPPSVAINVSACQFQLQGPGRGLAETVHDALTATQLAPRDLGLEITESLAMKDVDLTVGALKGLSETGVHLAIDDFGTGYSSLSCLRHFPIETLKIDRNFVRHLSTDADDSAIVAAMIAMAHALKLSVVAEGVETEEQLKFLRAHDCDAVQGHLAGAAMPVEELRQRLREGTVSQLARSS